MISYAIDISKPKIQEAMHRLGIDASELVQQPLSLFLEEAPSKDIAILRHEQHLRDLKKTKGLIMSVMNERRSIRTAHSVYSSRIESREIEKLKERNKEKLENMVKKEKGRLETRALSPSFSTNPDKRKQKLKELQEKQSQKYAEIVQQRELLEKREIRQQRQRIEDSSNEITPEKSRLSQNNLTKESSEEKLSKKLADFENKMRRSEKIHVENLTNIQKTASKSLERVLKSRSCRKNNSEERIIRLIKKQEAYQENRAKIGQQRQNKIIAAKNKLLERNIVAAQKTQMSLKSYNQKANSIEKRLAASHKLIETQKSELIEKIKMKQELNKIKTSDIHSNNRRKQMMIVRSH